MRFVYKATAKSSGLHMNFDIVDQSNLSKPCGNTNDNRAVDRLHRYQTFLLHNLRWHHRFIQYKSKVYYDQYKHVA